MVVSQGLPECVDMPGKAWETLVPSSCKEYPVRFALRGALPGRKPVQGCDSPRKAEGGLLSTTGKSCYAFTSYKKGGNAYSGEMGKPQLCTSRSYSVACLGASALPTLNWGLVGMLPCRDIWRFSRLFMGIALPLYARCIGVTFPCALELMAQETGVFLLEKLSGVVL